MSVEIELDKRFPTVNIVTSFPGYEKIKLSAVETRGDEKDVLELFVNVNDKDIIVITIAIIETRSYKKFHLIINVKTPFEGIKKARFEMKSDWRDPYNLKLMLNREGVEYAVEGQISVQDKEFYINMETPIEGYESIGMDGGFGSTTQRSRYGIGVTSNRERREVGLEYQMEEDVAIMKLKTPIPEFKSVSLKSSTVMNDDNGHFNFGFEFEGENNEFGIGLRYDLSKGPATGKLEVLLKAPIIEKEYVIAVLKFKNLDGDWKNGFEIEFHFTDLINNETANGISAMIRGELLEGDKARIKVNAQSQRSFGNFELILERQLSPTPRIEAVLTYNEKVFSILAVQNAPDLTITIKTPIQGYDNIELKISSIEDFSPETGGKWKAILTRETMTITQVDLTLNFVEGYNVIFDWKASESIWAKFEAELNDMIARISLFTPFPKCKKLLILAETNQVLDGNESKSITKLNFEYNNYFIRDTIEQVYRLDMTKLYLKTKTRTNIELLGYEKLENVVKFEQSSQTGKAMFTGGVKITGDDTPWLNFIMEGKSDAHKNIQIKAKISGKYPADFEGEIKIAYDKGEMLKIFGKFNDFKATLQVRYGANSLTATFSNNFLPEKKYGAQVEWDDTASGLTFKVKVNRGADENLLYIAVNVTFSNDSTSGTQVEVNAQVMGMKQWVKFTIDLSVNEINFTANTKGDLSNLVLELKAAKDDGREVNFNFVAKGDSAIAGPVDTSLNINVKLPQEVFKVHAELKTVIFDIPHSGLISVNEINGGSGYEASVILNSAYSPVNQIDASVEFGKQRKSVKLRADVKNQSPYELELTGEWSLLKSDIAVVISAESLTGLGTTMAFTGKRESFKKINYKLNAFNQYVFEVQSENVVESAKDFVVSGTFSAQVPGNEKLEYSLRVSSSSTPTTLKITGELTFSGSYLTPIKVSYEHDIGRKYQLKVTTPFALLKQLEFLREVSNDGKG